MLTRKHAYVIEGTVSCCNADKDHVKKTADGLENIGVEIFSADRLPVGCNADEAERATIYGMRFMYRTRTDKYGKYRFIVSKGVYSVDIIRGTLPEGKDFAGSSRIVDTGSDCNADFVLTDLPHTAPVLKTADNAVAGSADGMGPILSTDIDITGLAAIDRIDTAYRSGRIDKHKAILFSLHALLGNEALPDEYRSDIPIKSGTRSVEEIIRYIRRKDADADIVKVAGNFLASPVPPLDRSYRSQGGFFNIHYTTTGSNAVPAKSETGSGVPVHVISIAAALDRVKAVTCNSRGFRMPVTGAGNVLDVYVFNLKGKYGLTFPSGYSSGRSGVRTASCYICLDNDYSASKGFVPSREDCLKVTAAHEFFHAVQYAYNVDADSWWKEASASWNEDEIYPGINDYVRYIGDYFQNPQKSLEQSSYGGVVFVKFLSQYYGGYSAVKRVWEIHSAGTNNSVGAIDSAISRINGKENIGTAFNRFSAYNYNPSQYYNEGYQWKTPVYIKNTYAGYPVGVVKDRLDHLASRYLLFRPTGNNAGQPVRITIEGSSGAVWGFKVQKRNSGDGQCSLLELNPRKAYDKAEIILSGLGTVYDEVCLIPANLEKTRNQLEYAYTAILEVGGKSSLHAQ